MRKGIHQGLAADGSVITDERWQFVTLGDGGIQFDNETTRIAPFSEPRSDSITFLLDAQLRPHLFTIHGLYGHREGRVSWVDDTAYTCWQYGLVTHRREYSWKAESELDFASPFFVTAMIWRSRLPAGQARSFEALQLDTVTFAPAWRSCSLAAHGREMRRTRFGEMALLRYVLAIGDVSSDVWTDDEGVVFEMMGQAGGYRLAAVNFA